MSLARHIDADQIIAKAKDHKVHKHTGHRQDLHGIPYASRYAIDEELPRFKMPDDGVDSKAVYQLLHDELLLDGNPNMNLASFVHTWVPDECQRLIEENINKNLVDQDEYPAAQQIHERCISMISNLWHAPPSDNKGAIGTATTGSSEAIMLGGLALKRRWQERMKAQGKDIHNPGPNIIMGAEAQVALEKFARYFEVEMRLVDVSEKTGYVMSAENAMKKVDENTIGVFVILGSTYTGTFESVQDMAKALDEYEDRTGLHIPIHVDAASGGFVAPFAYPDYDWDFKIPRVESINASGHKYGMSVVGVGWIIWRSPEYLPQDLIFELHYLGQTDYSFNLNFSRPAHPILAQMFNFINLGFSGYRRIMLANLAKARLLSRALENSGYFTVLSNIHRPKAVTASTGTGDKTDASTSVNITEKAEQGVEAVADLASQFAAKVGVTSVQSAQGGGDTSIKHDTGKHKKQLGNIDEEDPTYYNEGLPVVSFRFSDKVKSEYPDIKQAWIQEQLRAIGWIVPNYPLPPACEDTEILRVVVRESLSGDLIRKLIVDILEVTETLLDGDGPSVSMMLAPMRAREAGRGNKGKQEGKHDDLAKKEISDNTTTWAKPC